MLVERWWSETSTFHLPVARDDGDTRRCVLPMEITYQGYFNFFNMLFYIIFLKFTNLILKYEKYRKTNNKGD
jgi:hypothetical protein